MLTRLLSLDDDGDDDDDDDAHYTAHDYDDPEHAPACCMPGFVLISQSLSV